MSFFKDAFDKIGRELRLDEIPEFLFSKLMGFQGTHTAWGATLEVSRGRITALVNDDRITLPSHENLPAVSRPSDPSLFPLILLGGDQFDVTLKVAGFAASQIMSEKNGSFDNYLALMRRLLSDDSFNYLESIVLVPYVGFSKSNGDKVTCNYAHQLLLEDDDAILLGQTFFAPKVKVTDCFSGSDCYRTGSGENFLAIDGAEVLGNDPVPDPVFNELRRILKFSAIGSQAHVQALTSFDPFWTSPYLLAESGWDLEKSDLKPTRFRCEVGAEFFGPAAGDHHLSPISNTLYGAFRMTDVSWKIPFPNFMV